MNVISRMRWAVRIRGTQSSLSIFAEGSAWISFMFLLPFTQSVMMFAFWSRRAYYLEFYGEVPDRVYWSLGGGVTLFLLVAAITWPIAFGLLRNLYWVLWNPYEPRFCLHSTARKQWLKDTAPLRVKT